MEQYKPPTTRLAFQSNNRYDVFLSFRGPDVRKTLVDHLYEALTQAGLNVFLDTDKLEKGEIIGLSLDSAIESSAIRIPIFSKGYADSAWCLKEASVMSRTPGLIIPLFYHVDPTSVRYPDNASSPYCRQFLKHSDRYRREEINDWKRALRQICSYSGWSLDLTQGYEARLIKMMVNDLRKTLKRVKKYDGGQNEWEEEMEEAKTDEKIQTVRNVKMGKSQKNGGEETILLNTAMEINKHEFPIPGYVIEYVHPPQLFSDENPNACSIM
ncbi:disease resistance protein L6 [Cryptomeria japonica]|uniref:disease resistance protein L6 n=1 Tax=Cryptomeria japonica TaxID=3369 RepID=UPI0025AB97F2|nr:disease resistance protein L6 [Cryptomeria japonica]